MPTKGSTKLTASMMDPRSKESVAGLSCFSTRYPPEIGSAVVVQVRHVDPTGVWGSLVDWGDCFTAYLPIGSIGKEKGRGERKAQQKFLTRANRSCRAKNKNSDRSGGGMSFVAYVQSAEPSSRGGVTGGPLDIGKELYHVNLTRRGVTNMIEQQSLDLSKDIQSCAKKLVDGAVRQSGYLLSCARARELTMGAAYEKALAKWCNSEDEEELEFEDAVLRAPVAFLLENLACLSGAEDVVDLLGMPRSDESALSFAKHLLSLCRKEKARRSKPIKVSTDVEIGGVRACLALGRQHPTPFDTHHIQKALQAAADTPVPEDCHPVDITVKGSGTYTFSTTVPSALEDSALGYLQLTENNAHRAWEQSALEPLPYRCPNPANTSPGDKKPSDHQPSLNIGVIGDVANGKSTLVKAISGKRTQAHSKEQQQHGITIRLGFANAAVLHCNNNNKGCGAYSFLPESEDNKGIASSCAHHPCRNCGQPAEIKRRFSLVDCPGHASLMATMLAGASTFDAVILAAAANIPCPTPQARQHLEAIQMSGIIQDDDSHVSSPRIAIAQTKAELLAGDTSRNNNDYTNNSQWSPEQRLEHHAEDSRQRLVGSVAARAPIFPVCSPLGLGLNGLAEWIANLPLDNTHPSEISSPSSAGTNNATNLSVIRSFDVNRPGSHCTVASSIKGGVLGGTLSGAGRIAIGDLLEARPGLLIPPSVSGTTTAKEEEKEPSNEDGSGPGSTFLTQPLQFECTALMTGKTALESAEKGGLIAVGTSLDPAICADNRMVGSVVGPPGTLPPVWGPTLLLDHLSFVALLPETTMNQQLQQSKNKNKNKKPSKIIKKGVEIRCHFGSATAKGEVIRLSKSSGKIEVRLNVPICASKGFNVALEAKDGGGSFVLVAHAKLSGGDLCLDGVDHEEGRCLEFKDSDEGLDELSVLDDDESRTRHARLLEHDRMMRQSFLKGLMDRNQDTSPDSGLFAGDHGSSRISLPHADIERDGGAHVLLSNFGIIAHTLRRDKSHLVSYLQAEGNLSCCLAGAQTSPATTSLRIRWKGGRQFAERFESILKKYCRSYVTCHQCRGAITELLGAAGANKTELVCRRCNARRFVTKL